MRGGEGISPGMHLKQPRFRSELTVLSNDVPDGGSWSNRLHPSRSHTLPLSHTHTYSHMYVHTYSPKHDVNEKVCLVFTSHGRPAAGSFLFVLELA